ncbi:hypothetical protein M758_12G032400 [Ceratodon purpureus]|nr:hypothetical protein M758_12G032400 [Ceratodon purpureus]
MICTSLSLVTYLFSPYLEVWLWNLVDQVVDQTLYSYDRKESTTRVGSLTCSKNTKYASTLLSRLDYKGCVDHFYVIRCV